MKLNHCDKCPKRHKCTLEYDKDIQEWIVICPLMRAELNRIENGDIRNKKNKHRPQLRFEAEMDRIEYIVFKNKVYGAYDGD